MTFDWISHFFVDQIVLQQEVVPISSSDVDEENIFSVGRDDLGFEFKFFCVEGEHAKRPF